MEKSLAEIKAIEDRIEYLESLQDAESECEETAEQSDKGKGLPIPLAIGAGAILGGVLLFNATHNSAFIIASLLIFIVAGIRWNSSRTNNKKEVQAYYERRAEIDILKQRLKVMKAGKE
ncbi:hypothetical protein WJT86_05415 [Microvirga sp. W0021]|uniref:Uncharacterized protein n=1 Tax=Hohaiivirga grylli TaxID=3133970 RepID=A0ABV0BIW2_9HYPH